MNCFVGATMYAARPPTQMPIAIPRCRGGKVAVMIESVAGLINAAPTPCTARDAISVSLRG